MRWPSRRIFLILSLLLLAIPLPVLGPLSALLLGILFLFIRLRDHANLPGEKGWAFTSPIPWVQALRGFAVPQSFFLRGQQLEGVLHVGNEEYPASRLRSLPSGAMLCAALTLMAEDTHDSASLQALLSQLRIQRSQFRKQYPYLSETEVWGVHGSCFRDGSQHRTFFLTDADSLEQRDILLSHCTHIMVGSQVQPLTDEERLSLRALPRQAILFFTALESELPLQLTYLGGLTLHVVDVPCQEAIDVATARCGSDFPVYALPLEGTGYQPVQIVAPQIPLTSDPSHLLMAAETGAPADFSDAMASEIARRTGRHAFFVSAAGLLGAFSLLSLLTGSYLPGLLLLLVSAAPAIALDRRGIPVSEAAPPWRIIGMCAASLALGLFGRFVFGALPASAGLGSLCHLTVLFVCLLLRFPYALLPGRLPILLSGGSYILLSALIVFLTRPSPAGLGYAILLGAVTAGILHLLLPAFQLDIPSSPSLEKNR